MNPLKIIFRKLNVLVAVSQPDGWRYVRYEVLFHRGHARIRCRTTFVPAAWTKKGQKTPWILVVGGDGVVSKSCAPESETARHIFENFSEFLSATEPVSGGLVRLTFMRREVYDGLMSALAACRLPLVSTRLLPGGDPFTEVRVAADDFFGTTLQPKALVQATSEANCLCELLYRRLLVPVLAVCLVALLANFFVQNGLRREAGEQRAELARLQQAAAAENRQKAGADGLRAMLLPASSYPYAWLADRIAGVVPPETMFTSLSVNPLTKKLQEGKVPVIQSGKIILRGYAPDAAPIARMADSLRRTEPFSRLKLTTLEKDRAGRYQFEIAIDL